MIKPDDNLDVWHTLTRAQPTGWTGHSRRIDDQMLREAITHLEDPPHTFVCGPTSFVEAVADGLITAGVAPDRIRTERFGPSGG